MWGSNDPLDFVQYIRDNSETFWELFGQHVELVGWAVLISLLIAVPLAIITSRIPVLEKPLTWVANIGQAVPSLAVLGLTLPWLGIGSPSLFALTVLAVLPIFLNTYVGINSADEATIDAARGMGSVTSSCCALRCRWRCRSCSQTPDRRGAEHRLLPGRLHRRWWFRQLILQGLAVNSFRCCWPAPCPSP